MKRIRLSEKSTKKLQILKGRTGLTPNILSRFALLYSLKSPGIPQKSSSDISGQEFSRYTLFGEFDPLFFALLKERCLRDGLDLKRDLASQLGAHLERGIDGVYGRVREIRELRNLL